MGAGAPYATVDDAVEGVRKILRKNKDVRPEDISKMDDKRLQDVRVIRNLDVQTLLKIKDTKDDTVRADIKSIITAWATGGPGGTALTGSEGVAFEPDELNRIQLMNHWLLTNDKGKDF